MLGAEKQMSAFGDEALTEKEKLTAMRVTWQEVGETIGKVSLKIINVAVSAVRGAIYGLRWFGKAILDSFARIAIFIMRRAMEGVVPVMEWLNRIGIITDKKLAQDKAMLERLREIEAELYSVAEATTEVADATAKAGDSASDAAKETEKMMNKTRAAIETKRKEAQALRDQERQERDAAKDRERQERAEEKRLQEQERQRERQLQEQKRLREEQLREEERTRQKVVGSYEWLADRINQLTLSTFNYRREQIIKEYMEHARVVGLTKELREALAKELRKIDDEEAKAVVETERRKKEEHIKALETIRHFTTDYHIFRLEQLDEIAEKMRQEGIAEIDIVRWKTEEIKGLEREHYQFQLEQADNYRDAIAAKFRLMAMDVKTEFQKMADFIETVFKSLEDTLGAFFFDAMQGRLKSLWDYVQAFLNAVQRAIADMLAQEIVGGIKGLISPLFAPAAPRLIFPTPGIGLAHKGGYIPKFHFGGLAGDEIPAILQRGEYVVSRKGVEALDRINRGDAAGRQDIHNYYYIQAVDAKSFADMIERNPGAMIKVLHENKRQGGPLWR